MDYMSFFREYSIEELSGNVDFAIMTIREDEFEALLKRFDTTGICRGKSDYHIWEGADRSGRELTIAMARQGEQGHSSAQQLANYLIDELQPNCIVLTGIGGAKPETEFSLGDVIIATRIRDFSLRAQASNGTIEYAELGGPIHARIQTAVASLPAMRKHLGDWASADSVGMRKPPVSFDESNFTGDADWKNKVRTALAEQFKPEPVREGPLVTGGTFASGNILVKDPQLLESWLSTSARDLKAVEMELPGVYQAAHRDPPVPVLAIRGISDIVGFKRNPLWTTYACESAAAFTFAYLTNEITNKGLLNLRSGSRGNYEFSNSVTKKTP